MDRKIKNRKTVRHVKYLYGAEKKRRGVFDFWENVGEQVNDNAQSVDSRGPRFALIAGLAMVAGLLFSLNSSVVMTQAVLHADPAVLSTAMNVSPDAVAYALNKMNVGE